MLGLSRRINEQVIINHKGTLIKVKVLSISRNQVSLGFDAPNVVTIDREEIYKKKQQSKVEGYGYKNQAAD